ncbi:TPA: GTPase Era [Candidatus Poribacteria bacterium]|nr:GTPase Era [Candidatus Poribacteria bacterium]
MEKKKNFKSGFVAIVGKPNVGKSTLLNSFLGQKLSIVTPKAQTTRNRITGILTGENYQIIFFDTPGIFEPSYKLQQYMVRNAIKSASEADLILLMVSALSKPDSSEKEVIKKIKELNKKTLLVLNKIDKIQDKGLLLPLIAEYNSEYGFDEIMPISALKGDGVAELLKMIVQYLPYGEIYYPEDEISNMPERFFIAEIIREKLFMQTQKEVPYSTTVQTEEMKVRDDGKTYIRATIYVERDSQKGIIIGNKGNMLKKIGQEARKDIEDWLNTPVYLDLWVSVKDDWRDKDSDLREFGYNP